MMGTCQVFAVLARILFAHSAAPVLRRAGEYKQAPPFLRGNFQSAGVNPRALSFFAPWAAGGNAFCFANKAKPKNSSIPPEIK